MPPQLFSTSRAEAAVYRFPPLFFPVTAVLALGLQAYLPTVIGAAIYLDLPLLVVVYWAMTTRQPGTSAIIGAGMGLAEDSLSHLALGVNGIAKTLIGYLAATAGNKMDAEHAGVRWAVIFIFFEMNRAMIYGFERFLLGTPVPWRGVAVALAAAANGVLAVILYRGMDRFRRWM